MRNDFGIGKDRFFGKAVLPSFFRLKKSVDGMNHQIILLKIIFGSLFCCRLLAGSLEISGNGVADFGSYPAAESKEHTFQLVNATQETVKIKKIRSTCGCLVGQISASEILPGKALEIQTQVKANSVSGKFSKILYVETDLAGRRFIRLELKGTAQPLVEITPAVPFYAGKLQAGQVYEFRFELEPSQSGVVLSAAVDSGCRLEKSEGKWFAVCKLTPAGGTAIVEKEFRIDVVSPTGQPPLSIRIRGLLAD